MNTALSPAEPSRERLSNPLARYALATRPAFLTITFAGCLLGLPAAPTADAADALACAICHAHGGQGLGALATAGYRVRGGRLIG